MNRVRVLLGLVLLFGLNTQANEYIDESLFKLSLSELLAIELEVGSTVSLITREQWRQRGARHTDDAFGGGNALANTLDGFSSEYVNRGENKASGVEFEGRLLANHFDLSGGISWVKSESISEDLDYVAFPEYIINLDVNFTVLPETLTISLFNRLHLNADSGPIKNNIPNPAPLEDYFRTDLSFSGKINTRLDYYFHVRNLFDRDNKLPSVWNSEGGIGQQGINANAAIRMVF